MNDRDLDGICKIRINDWLKLKSNNTQWKVIGFGTDNTQYKVSQGVRTIEHHGAEYVQITRNTTETISHSGRGNGGKKKRVSVPLIDWLKITSNAYWNETYLFRVNEKRKEDGVEDDTPDLADDSDSDDDEDDNEGNIFILCNLI